MGLVSTGGSGVGRWVRTRDVCRSREGVSRSTEEGAVIVGEGGRVVVDPGPEGPLRMCNFYMTRVEKRPSISRVNPVGWGETVETVDPWVYGPLLQTGPRESQKGVLGSRTDVPGPGPYLTPTSDETGKGAGLGTGICGD